MKRIISIVISLAILAFIYWRIDLSALAAAFRNTDGFWLAISLGMVIPLTLLTAWRLAQLAPASIGLGFWEATRLTLAASGLNMILPSKMGDIAKAYFMQRRGHLTGASALSLVVFEKASDMLSLLVWCAIGLVIYPTKDALFWGLSAIVLLGLGLGFLLLGSRWFAERFFALARKAAPGKFRDKLDKLAGSWLDMLAFFWRDRGLVVQVMLTSLLIWFLHLVQTWFFVLALRAWTPFLANLALAPLAILVGLLPFTFAGMGTRDAAILFFYRPFLSAPVAAALGILFTMRYFLPAVAGAPFLAEYMVRPKVETTP